MFYYANNGLASYYLFLSERIKVVIKIILINRFQNAKMLPLKSEQSPFICCHRVASSSF